MSNLSEFLHMGGYAFYVWWSYGIVALVLLGNILVARAKHKRFLGTFQRQLARAENQSSEPTREAT